MNELVHYEGGGGIATITLDSPRNRNALSRQLVTELAASVELAIADPTVKVAVLAAAGPAFCSGADLAEQSSRPADAGTAATGAIASLPDVVERIMTCELPFVARVHGAVRAGGTGLVAACDIAIADATVTFAFPEVHLGLVPAIIAVPLTRVLDRRALRRYLFTGEPFGAAEAARIGLVTAAADDLDAEMASVLDGFAKAHPAALRRTKRLFDELDGLGMATGLRLAGDVSAQFFASADGQEGIRAVLEKRAPSWR
ncbi:enoyl-CoA hydratase-related protein [Desertimonas flava]|uniref:enoyl-CoA hydratase-related protein n=1 Tax=Desertimonas flava TaxID=2064846 RepID=UPI000E341771|nr:enoyl-CoA hydratase-related protein [Desertimonas flava]